MCVWPSPGCKDASFRIQIHALKKQGASCLELYLGFAFKTRGKPTPWRTTDPLMFQHDRDETRSMFDWLIDVFIWKPNRLGVPSYRESHVSGKGVPKSREFNIGMPQRRRQRVPQKWASKERRDCTRAVTDVWQGKRDKRLTPCYRSCACIWLAKNRKFIC